MSLAYVSQRAAVARTYTPDHRGAPKCHGDRGAASRPGTFSTGGSKRTAMCEGLRFMLGLCFALQAVVEHLGLDAVDAEAQMQRGVDCIGREGARGEG